MTRSEIQAFLIRLGIITLFVAGLWLIFQARDILWALLLAGLTAILVSPIVGAIERRKIPGNLAIFLLFAGALVLVLFWLVVVFPLLAKQFFHFEAIIRSSVDNLSSLAASPESLQDLRIVKYLDQMNMPVDVASITGFVKENLPGALDQIGKFVTQGGKSFFTWVFGFFGAFSNAVLYFIFLIFILAERKELFRSLVSFLPKQTASEIGKRVPKIQTTLLSWWKGQAILCSFIGIMTLIVLVILSAAFGIRVENHLSLALIAGLCEFIPILGPMIAMVPALLIGIQWGWGDAVVLAVAYVSIQQIESLYLVPKVHGTALKLSNLEVLVWMTLSGTLFGILGILFTLPVLAVSKILLSSKTPS